MNRPFFPLSDDNVSRSLIAAAMFSFAGFFVTAPALLYDDRLINGVSVWWKPLKFWLSLGIQFATFAVLAQLLTVSNRNRIGLKAFVYIAIVSLAFENVYITIQAARGRASHFNFETQFESGMYALMGLGALTFVILGIIIGAMLAFQRDGDRSGLKLGAILGLIIGSAFTLAYGGFMSTYGSHYFAAPGISDIGGLPIVGWSTMATDLRPAHFTATHMLQFVPFAGWLADRIAPAQARIIVWLTTILLAAIATILFVLPLRGVAPLGFLDGVF